MTDPLSAAANAATLAARIAGFLRYLWAKISREDSSPLLPGPSAFRLRPQQQHPFELRPIRFEIFLDATLPTVEVWFYGINYRRRALTLWTALVPGLYLSGGTKLENIPLLGEPVLESGSASTVCCRRTLADSEARVVTQMHQGAMAHATYEVTARARDRRAEVTYRGSSYAVDGWIHLRQRPNSAVRDAQPNNALESTGAAKELDAPAAQRARWADRAGNAETL